jgi:hypothetical protein
MIGHLGPETVENLTTLAKKGILVSGQQETALAAFDLLCRDAFERSEENEEKKQENLRKITRLGLVLESAAEDEEIEKRIRIILGPIIFQLIL